MNKRVNKEIQRQITAPLREVMKSLGASEESVLGVWNDILHNSEQDSNRLRAVELFVKWMALSAPDKIEISQVDIGLDVPEDLDM